MISIQYFIILTLLGVPYADSLKFGLLFIFYVFYQFNVSIPDLFGRGVVDNAPAVRQSTGEAPGYMVNVRQSHYSMKVHGVPMWLRLCRLAVGVQLTVRNRGRRRCGVAP